MGIEEKTPNAPGYWQEETDRQTLYCLANFLPGRAFERWWVYGLVSDNDSRSSYRHTFGSRFDYDGRVPIPSPRTLRNRSAMLHYLHVRGVYLKLLTWGGFRSAYQHHFYLDWKQFQRLGDFNGKPRRQSYH
jgi:hypothetical protein